MTWTRLYPDQPVSNMILVQHTETDPPTFHYLASSMSTSPTLATPPRHNFLSNPNFNPTTALVVLMQQTIQQNATMMAHMHERPSPPSAPQPPTSQQYKQQRPPPFQKWYGTPPTTPLFLAQFLTYKAEAFYSGVHDWTHTTQSSKHFSIVISADILVSLP